jgi:hypothetical protein
LGYQLPNIRKNIPRFEISVFKTLFENEISKSIAIGENLPFAA